MPRSIFATTPVTPAPPVALVAAAAIALACGCSAARYASAPAAITPAASASAPAPAPRPLERSIFSRDPAGQLSEERIQEILAAPLELDLPARVGVLPVVAAADWRGPSPDYASAPAAAADLVKGLRGSELFSLVSEMVPIPSGALGMEALREIAARYSLRYVVLYREALRDRKRSNAWAAGYATLVGALFLPGETLEVDGYVEASLFDVKTGLLLFTVRRRISGIRRSSVWHTGDKTEALRDRAAAEAAPDLARDVRKAVYRYAEAVGVENTRAATARRIGASPAAATAGPLPAAEVAAGRALEREPR